MSCKEINERGVLQIFKFFFLNPPPTKKQKDKNNKLL